MSWGTSFKADIFISRQTFDSVHDVRASIKDYEDSIQHLEKRLMMLVAATPSGDITELQYEVEEILEGLRHDLHNLEMLRLFGEHLEENGKDPKEFID